MSSRPHFDNRDLARIAIFAALIIVFGVVGSIPIPGGVPITLQTLAVMLAGTVLGAWRGMASVLVVLLLALVGLPVLSGGAGGAAVFVGPTAGYLYGWVPGVAVVGLIAHSGRPSWWRTGLACAAGGIGVVYVFGIPGTALALGLPVTQAAVSAAVFLPGDVAKAILATAVTSGLWRAYPAAFPVALRNSRGHAGSAVGNSTGRRR